MGSPVAKHYDAVTGIDIHLIVPPGSLPIPVPHPLVGMLFDPMDDISMIGSSVAAWGVPRAVVGTMWFSWDDVRHGLDAAQN